MTYKAVLFDLDGTLLDTLDDLANSMNRVLAQGGFPTHDVACYRYFVGDGLLTLVKRVLPEECRDEETVQRCFTAMQAEYGRRWAELTRPYDGIPELLQQLAERAIPLTILSNKPDEWTQIMVRHFFPQQAFQLVYGQRPSVPKKPDPAGALEIAAALDIPPEQFLYLGDTNTDMQTANSAGMMAIGVLWGFRPAEELLAAGAKKLIAQPSELLAYF
ncbi:HAD family hydrolase [Heliobacterium chlorum]|uniref:HAD family hydrolase n=1 Tax=Heliobacterium chlorum TaxID=2698 RepID=A0ABR7T797_HELCL|nr:HAD family hydrolase [Heliobacterium chlorum]MBC9785724.1 HAD family hydrolase [Heliobacterium chlorum]